MNITAPCVVSLVWRLEDTQGTLIDELKDPVEFFFGGDDLLAKVEEVLADQDGKVIFVKSISGHPLLRDAAVDAAWGWAFRPTQLKGNPGKYYVRGTITFVFRVESPEVEKKEIESINQQIGEIRKEGLANPQSAQALPRRERPTAQLTNPPTPACASGPP